MPILQDMNALSCRAICMQQFKSSIDEKETMVRTSTVPRLQPDFRTGGISTMSNTPLTIAIESLSVVADPNDIVRFGDNISDVVRAALFHKTVG